MGTDWPDRALLTGADVLHVEARRTPIMRTQPHGNLVGPALPWSPHEAIEFITDRDQTDDAADAETSTRKSVWYWMHRPSAPPDVVGQVQDIMNAAAEFERSFDFAAAGARARDAAALVASITAENAEDLADAVALAGERIETRGHAWRNEVERRAAAYDARERAAANGPDDAAPARHPWRRERGGLRADRQVAQRREPDHTAFRQRTTR